MHAHAPQRHIYIDLGVNWCNSLKVYAHLADPKRVTPTTVWEVYGFEASPLIMPFVESTFAWLNGLRADRPESCLPPSGSTDDLNRFAPAYGCPTIAVCSTPGCDDHSAALMRACMKRRLAPYLDALRPLPALNSSALRAERLALAWRASSDLARRFTFVPAAAGVAEGWLDVHADRFQLIRGGVLPALNAKQRAAQGERMETYRVATVDVPGWVQRSFSRADYVVMKVDIEGGEHVLLEALLGRGLLDRIDVLSLECHELGGAGPKGHKRVKRCAALADTLRAAARQSGTRLIIEGASHKGYGSALGSESGRDTTSRVQHCARIEPARMSISWLDSPA